MYLIHQTHHTSLGVCFNDGVHYYVGEFKEKLEVCNTYNMRYGGTEIIKPFTYSATIENFYFQNMVEIFN